MLLDTLKQFAFENMDVEISKDKDTGHIIIENSSTEIRNRPDSNAIKIMRIVTKINLDGEIVSSKIFSTFKIRADNIYIYIKILIKSLINQAKNIMITYLLYIVK